MEYQSDHRCKEKYGLQKYLRLSTLHRQYCFLHIYMCVTLKDVGINKGGKELYLLNREFVSLYRYERTTMAAKCELFINCSKSILSICQKQI